MNVQVAVEASTSSTTSNEGTLKIQFIALGVGGGNCVPLGYRILTGDRDRVHDLFPSESF